MLKSGLDGIKRGWVPPEPIEENIYQFDENKLKESNIDTLPSSLGEAVEEMEKDEIVRETLGHHTYPLYIKAKRAECDDYRIQVTKWELDKYFETV